MRRTASVVIDGHEKQFIINEITIQQIITFTQLGEDPFKDLSLEGLKRMADKYLPQFSNVTLDDMQKMAPSEVMQLVDAFKEVNSDFLSVAQKMGLTDVLMNIKRAIMSDFSNLLVDLLKPDTEESSTTVTPTLDTP